MARVLVAATGLPRIFGSREEKAAKSRWSRMTRLFGLLIIATE